LELQRKPNRGIRQVGRRVRLGGRGSILGTWWEFEHGGGSGGIGCEGGKVGRRGSRKGGTENSCAGTAHSGGM